MPNILIEYQTEIWVSIGETSIMVGFSILAALLLVLPVGTFLFLCRKGQLLENQLIFSSLNLIVNIIRSFPFLLLVIFMIPITRFIIGTAIGTVAATLPMVVIAIAHYSRLVEQSLRSEEHTSELQSRGHLVCRLLLEKKKKRSINR